MNKEETRHYFSVLQFVRCSGPYNIKEFCLGTVDYHAPYITSLYLTGETIFNFNYETQINYNSVINVNNVAAYLQLVF